LFAPHRHSVPLDPGPRSADYAPRCPEQTPFYLALSERLETFLARRLSLHAAVAVPAHDRQRLERLCRFVARPPLASERLSRLDDGRVLYRLERRWRDSTLLQLSMPLDGRSPSLRSRSTRLRRAE